MIYVLHACFGLSVIMLILSLFGLMSTLVTRSNDKAMAVTAALLIGSVFSTATIASMLLRAP